MVVTNNTKTDITTMCFQLHITRWSFVPEHQAINVYRGHEGKTSHIQDLSMERR